MENTKNNNQFSTTTEAVLALGVPYHKHSPWTDVSIVPIRTSVEALPPNLWGLADTVSEIKNEAACLLQKYVRGGADVQSRSFLLNPPHAPNVRRVQITEAYRKDDVKWPDDCAKICFTQATQYPVHPDGWFVKRAKVRLVSRASRVVQCVLEFTIHNYSVTDSLPLFPIEDVSDLFMESIRDWSVNPNELPFEEMKLRKATTRDYVEYFTELFNPKQYPEIQMKLTGSFMNLWSSETEESVQEMTDAYSELANDMKGVLPTAKETMTNANSLFGKLTQLADDHSDLPSRVKEVLGKAEKALEGPSFANMSTLRVVVVMALCAAAIHAAISDNPNRFLMFGAVFLISAALNSSLIKKVSVSMMEVLQEWTINRMAGVAHMQDGDEPGIVDSLVSLLVVSMVGTQKTASSCIKMLSSLSFDKMKSNILGIFKSISDLCLKIAKGLGFDHLVPDKYKLLYLHNEEIRAFALEIDTLHDKMKEGSFNLTDGNFEYVKAMLIKAEQLTIKLGSSKQNVGYVNVIRDRILFLRKLRDKFVSSNYATDGRRPVPVAICLAGPPNTLKSQTLEHLAYAIAAKHLSPEELQKFIDVTKDFVYPVPISNEFWDGYKPSAVFTMFQDFLQKLDVAGMTDNEITKFMNIMEESAYILNMAHLDQKGTTFFNSKFIFLTTNAETIQLNSIRSGEALARRFTFWVLPKPMEKYDKGFNETGMRDGRVDYDALPKGKLGVPSANPDFMEFWEKDKKTGALTGKVYTFQELVDAAVAEYDLHEKWFKQKTMELLERAKPTFIPKKTADIAVCVDHTFASQQGGFDLSAFRNEVVNMVPLEEYDFEVSDPKIEQDAFLKLSMLLRDQDRDKYGWFLKWLDRAAKNSRHALTGAGYGRLCMASCPGKFLALIENGEFGIDPPLAELESLFVQEIIDEHVVQVDLPKRPLFFDTAPLLSRLELIKDYVTEFFWDFVEYAKMYAGYGAIASFGIYLIMKYFGREKDYDYIDVQIKDSPRVTGTIVRKKADTNQKLVMVEGEDGKDKMSRYKFKQHSKVWYLPCDRAECPYNFDNMYDPEDEDDPYPRWKLIEYDGSLYHHATITDLDFDTTHLTNDQIKLVQQYGINVQSNKKTKGGKNKGPKKPRHRNQHPSIQAAHITDPNALSIVESVLNRNCYVLNLVNPATKSRKIVGLVTAIMDTWIMVPAHFHRKSALQEERAANDGAHWEFMFARESQTVAFHVPYKCISEPSAYYVPAEKKDLMFIQLPREHFKVHRRIDKYFLSRKEIERQVDMSFWLVGCHGSFVNSYTGTARYQASMTAYNEKKELQTFDDVIKYKAATVGGDCGALFVLLNPQASQKLCGIHTSGFEGREGFATVVTSEMFEPMIKDLDTVKEDGSSNNFWTDQMGDLFEPLKIVERGLPLVSRTKIIPSDLAGCWEAPVVVPGDLTREAYELARDRYARPSVRLPWNVIPHVTRTLFEHYEHVSSRNVERRLLTYTEAVEGLSDDPEYGAICRQTSAGYPLCLHVPHGHEGRTHFFGAEGPFEHSDLSRQLEKDIRKVVADAGEGLRNEFIYSDNLKDEKVSLKKFQAKKTRLFSAVPLKYLVIFRMYFGTFMLWYAKNKIDNSSGVGINPHDESWHHLFRSLLGSNKMDDICFFAGDFKGFDQCGKPFIYFAILDQINRWYSDGEENARVRRVLWLELTQSKHIRGTIVYEWSRSLPSGHPMTTIVNTIYNHVAYRYCFYRAMGDNLYYLYHFHECVHLCSFGDDVVGTVKQDFRDVFNELTIGPFMEELGLVYTTDLKVEATVPLRKYSEVTFLKRGFRWSEEVGSVVGPHEMGVLRYMPFWTKRSTQYRKITEDIVLSVLRELTLWGREEFETFAPVILSACRERMNWVPPATTYETCLDLAYHYSDEYFN